MTKMKKIGTGTRSLWSVLVGFDW